MTLIYLPSPILRNGDWAFVADNLAYQDNPYESSSFLSCKLIESIKGETN